MNAQHIIASVDDIVAKGKSLQKAKKGVEASKVAEREAREKAKELKREMLAISTAMVNEDDLSEFRDSEVVHKELLKANNRIDKMIDKTNKLEAALEDLAEELIDVLDEDKLSWAVQGDAEDLAPQVDEEGSADESQERDISAA